MGCNFYAHLLDDPETHRCSQCEQVIPAPPLHIGKSSMGWCFSLHVIPERDINELEDWIKFIQNNDVDLRDEYGDSIGLDELITRITERSHAVPLTDERARAAGIWAPYRDLEDFLARNHAVVGPNNLLRHDIDGTHCVGHGAGTWDLIAGEFS